MRFIHGITGAALAAALVALAPTDAQACGGCFPPQPPPGESQSVVTDHRMVLSVSQGQTTLYDQIRYSGEPSSFAWVLPIAGTVTVGLSADTVFQALESQTQTTVQSPPDGCPSPTNCGYASADERASGTSAGSSSSGGVEVLKQEVVGPYETVQLRSTDPLALDNWLAQNGYTVPADVKPVITAYVNEKFDFLALKLLPGKGVSSMRPVRVTTQGATAVLPLRMVAAGTGAVVGVSLWVIGEGRYEPQNFPTFALRSEDLTWDWATRTSNYKELRAAKTTELAGRGWEVESSVSFSKPAFQNIMQRYAQVAASSGGTTGGDYVAEEKNGQVVKPVEQVRAEDIDTLFNGISPGKERVTRMRADLAKAALANDLVLIASGDQTELQNVRIPKIEKGQPTCTIYSGCTAVGTAPRDEAVARSGSGNTESFACDSGAKRAGGGKGIAVAGGLAAFAAIALVRARRARKQREQDQ
ncbi:MAG: DUF2330 domain-containing protein [Deltaproteobacteria bacterium]|nr:DUF2330 domain-containing protein [Deltaproteobacteria bacterium]